MSLSHWLRISFVNSFEFFGIVAAEECAPIIGNRLMAAVSALRGISAGIDGWLERVVGYNSLQDSTDSIRVFLAWAEHARGREAFIRRGVDGACVDLATQRLWVGHGADVSY